MDKTGRNGMRVGDTMSADFKERYNFLVASMQNWLSFYDYQYN